MRIIQCNLNRSRVAYDLLMQHTNEWSIDVCLISEPPYSLQDRPSLCLCKKGLAAIWWDNRVNTGPVKVRKKCDGFVVVGFKSIDMISCYLPPSDFLRRMSRRLDDMADFLRSTVSEAIIGGDFNAAFILWGARNANIRGDHVEIWAAGLDLRILNVGKVPTCVRPQGSSVADLTWCTPRLVSKMSKWRVALDTETLSDHNYIMFEFEYSISSAPPGRSPLGWNWRKMDADRFQASLLWSCATCQLSLESNSADEYADWIATVMRNAADCSTPRLVRPVDKKSAYWWCDEIRNLRSEAIASRRRWCRVATRSARCLIYQRDADICRQSCRQAKKKLRVAIVTAKARAWGELLNLINEDPWGLPYKLVLGRLRPATAALMETMDPPLVRTLIDGLFPNGTETDPRTVWSVPFWDDQCTVDVTEIYRAIKDSARNSAPGLAFLREC